MGIHAHSQAQKDPLRVLIVGAGVAGLEAVLALHEMAGEKVALTLLAPDEHFVYRPLSVYQAFLSARPRNYPLVKLLGNVGVVHVQESFRWLDHATRTVHTDAGTELRYDAAILALGARRRPRFAHAVTIDDAQLGEQLRPLLDELDRTQSLSVAMVVPSRPHWPLPIYELALMTAGRAQKLGRDWKITIVTPEDSALEAFGTPASDAVATVLAEAGVELVTSQTAQIHEPHKVSLYPSGHDLYADAIYALPELYGPSVPGVPTDAERGFISVDPTGAVKGLDCLYAVGDAVDFPLKFGGLAAQQADTAAKAIAARAGADVRPTPLQATVRGVLLGTDHPLYMQAQVSYLHGIRSEVDSHPLWDSADKLSARYLTDHLAAVPA